MTQSKPEMPPTCERCGEPMAGPCAGIGYYCSKGLKCAGLYNTDTPTDAQCAEALEQFDYSSKCGEMMISDANRKVIRRALRNSVPAQIKAAVEQLMKAYNTGIGEDFYPDLEPKQQDMKLNVIRVSAWNAVRKALTLLDQPQASDGMPELRPRCCDADMMGPVTGIGYYCSKGMKCQKLNLVHDLTEVQKLKEALDDAVIIGTEQSGPSPLAGNPAIVVKRVNQAFRIINAARAYAKITPNAKEEDNARK